MTRPSAFALVLVLAATAGAHRGRLAQVKHWGYQLQGEPPHPSAAADCLVVDPGGDSDHKLLSPAQVQELKTRAGKPPRIVLAYLSIGEAENYRWYWKADWSHHPPPFLAQENRRWHGNFKVRYWDGAWQAIVMKSLDRVLEAGFDGVYLDIIDAFEHFGPDGPKPERKTAAADMAELVARIGRHAREERGSRDFLVVPQNGANILEALSAAEVQAYLATIDGIGAEDAFYSGHRAENNALSPDKDVVAALERFRDAGKTVLSVEYVTLPEKVSEYVKLARAHRFVPTIARRELDRLLELKE